MAISGDPEAILTIDSAKFFELVKAFFKEKVPLYKCSVCGDSRLDVSRFMDDDVLVGLAGSVPHGTIGPILYTYTMTCMNCGNTNLHDYGILLKWVREKNLLPEQTPEAAQEDDIGT